MHYAAGYGGPWIENLWISRFSHKVTTSLQESDDLRRTFGPYIPLFIPWVDLWVNENPLPYKYPPGFVRDLSRALDPSVLYVTVSQSALGITAYEIPHEVVRNVLVFSAGGNGHVPIPLLKGDVPSCPQINITRRKYFVTFAGSLEKGADQVRYKMEEIVQNFTLGEKIFIGKTADWLNKTCETTFNLCPRGTGRTSYRLFETLQAGRIPIYVFSHIPWIPYRDRIQRYIWLTELKGLASLLRNLSTVPERQLSHLEETILGMRDTHFTYQGVLNQISMFLVQGERSSDLRCEVLPNSIGFSPTK